MAVTDIGRAVPLYKGDYTEGTSYELNDIVRWHGSTYWHKSRDITAGIAPSDTTVWSLITDVRAAEDYVRRAETAAEQAEQSAAVSGYVFFETDGRGHLILSKTPSVTDLDFELVEGRLKAYVRNGD